MFDYSNDQLEQRALAAKFSESINSRYITLQPDHDADFLSLWKAYVDFGITGLPLPEEWGGVNHDLFSMLAVLEGLGYGSDEFGIMFSLSAHIWACEIPLLFFGTTGQKSQYLPLLCGGQMIGAHCMSEPDAGSDIGMLRSHYRREKGGFYLTGEKVFVTNAPLADLFIVFAVPGGEKATKMMSCFLVEKDFPGITIGKPEQKMGLDWSPMAAVHFDNCFVPEKNLLGEEGLGLNIFNMAMAYERPFLFAFQIGLMERVLEKCVRYARQRKQGGQKIIKFQGVAHKLADMKVNLEVSKLLVKKVAFLLEERKFTLLDSSIAKLFISEHFVQNALAAMEIFGSYGYMREYKLEKFLRDCIAGKFYSGTSPIQRNIISELL